MRLLPNEDYRPNEQLTPELKHNTLGKLGVIVFVKSLVELYKNHKEWLLNSLPPSQAITLSETSEENSPSHSNHC
jgi:hypothetical protein